MVRLLPLILIGVVFLTNNGTKSRREHFLCSNTNFMPFVLARHLTATQTPLNASYAIKP
jgi:hypothetical protein